MKRIFAGLVILLLISAAAFSQTATSANVSGKHSFGPHYSLDFQNERLDSKLMAREMPYRIILPLGYAAGKEAAHHYSVIYLLHGLTGHFDNWTDKTKLAEYAANYKFIIVTPEGDDGWYTDSASVPNDKYESYIVKELIPEIDKKFRTVADRDHRAIAGLSMGGFGALKFGLKYPEMFSLAGSFSGAIGASSYRTIEEIPLVDRRRMFTAIFGDPGSPTHSANNLFKMIRDAMPEKINAMPFLYIDCGTEDFLFQNNRDFVNLLIEKKVPHEFRELPGAHNWTYWDQQVQEFLRIADKRLKK